MKHAEQATPNCALREERELRGWSQNYLAEQLEAPSPSYVSRWERGTASPSPYYREKLCRIFGKNAQELGLLSAQEMEVSEVSPHEHFAQQPTYNSSKLDELPYTPLPLQGCEESPLGRDQSTDSIDQGREKGPDNSFPATYRRRGRRNWPILIGVALAVLVLLLAISVSIYPQLGVSAFTPVSRLSPSTRSWPTFAYNLHTTSPEVKTIQLMLISYGYDIGKFGVDGVFGADTENAVRNFQEARQLRTTGVVESRTWEKLIASSALGAQGSHVLALQMQLNLHDAKLKLKVDGTFGYLTEKALRQFQRDRSLPVIGQANLNTWCLLVGGHL